jgi:hypothetical protein
MKQEKIPCYFPHLGSCIQHEYDGLGEEFEDNEHKLFGADGFSEWWIWQV